MTNTPFTRKKLRAGTALQALALLGAGVIASAAFVAPASAQDYTTGSIAGTVTDESGQPVANAEVELRSLAQNQARTFTTNSAGAFNAVGLAAGQYTISVTAPGFSNSQDTITIASAQQNRVTVSLVSSAGADTDIVVIGHVRQVTTQATTGVSINVAKLNANAPIGHDITSVALLAPTTQRGVSGFTSPSGESVPSIGGSSVAENAYYINGLNITNPDTYVGSSRVPFYFYNTVDVQTGGYPAEFGRATGGVLNATTKSGSNDFYVGAHFDWNVGDLAGHHPNIGQTDDTLPTSIGNIAQTDEKQATLEVGGPLIRDHLFFYGLVQSDDYLRTSASAASGSYYRYTTNDPFWGGKIDAYITPTQHAEFTIFDTRQTMRTEAFDFTPNAAFNGGTVGDSKGVEYEETGGLNWVARYTGNITDWFTISGAYGIAKDRDNLAPSNPDAYYVLDYRTSTCSGCVVSTDQPYGSLSTDATRRRFYRADADLRFTAAGDHHVRFGFDNEDLSENKVTQLTGAMPIRYYYYDRYIRLIYERLGGHVSAKDTAYYIEDSWTTPLDGLTLNYGIRDDIFKQTNLAGEQYLDFKNNWGPRVSFTYTPNGDSKLKLYGSYGRNFIPPAMNLGFRGRDMYFLDYFNYPAGYTAANYPIDPTTGLPAAGIGTPYNAGQTCPLDISSAPGAPTHTSTPSCIIYGGGIQNPALAKVVPGTNATYEDEFILGADYQVSSLLKVGLHGVYRVLHRGAEDTDFAPLLADYYCGQDSGSDKCDFYSNNSAYYIWNPGASSVTLNDWVDAIDGTATPVTLTDLQFPKMKRTYKAIILDFDKADDGRWMGGGSITWSRAKGNTEGTVKSDAGNTAQSDAGSTTDFDYVGLTDYSYGRLPNDHEWQFKLYGAYHFNDFFTLGTNIFVQSPMHGSCEGIHPTDPNAAGYLANSYFCGDESTYDAATDSYGENIPSPRGSGWKSDWMTQVDLSARINVPIGDDSQHKFTIRADVFNVFNSHKVIQRYGENESGSYTTDAGATRYQADPLYLTPLYYQTPRTVRVGFDLTF